MNWNRFEADVASQTSALLQSRPLEFSYDRSPVRDPQLAQISHELGSDPSPTAVNNKFGINYLPTGADVLNLGGMKVGEARTASVLVMERDINEMMTTIRGQNEKIAKLERIISSHGASTEYSTNALKTQIEWIERQQTASTESITKLTKNQGDESRRINIFGRKMKDFFYQQSSHDERLEEISQSQRNLLQLVQSTVTQVGDLSSTVETLRARSFQASSFAESLLQALIDLNGQITSTSDVMVHTKHIGQLLTGAINTTTKALSDSISENEASSKQKIQGLQQNLTSLSESLQLVRVDNQALTEKSDQVQRLASAISTRDGAYQSRLDSNEGNIQSLRLTLDLTRKQTETNLLKVTEFNESIRRICADVDEIKLRKYIEEDTIAGHTEVQFDQKLKHMGDELMKLSTDLNSVINSEKEANEVDCNQSGMAHAEPCSGDDLRGMGQLRGREEVYASEDAENRPAHVERSIIAGVYRLGGALCPACEGGEEGKGATVRGRSDDGVASEYVHGVERLRGGREVQSCRAQVPRTDDVEVPHELFRGVGRACGPEQARKAAVSAPDESPSRRVLRPMGGFHHGEKGKAGGDHSTLHSPHHIPRGRDGIHELGSLPTPQQTSQVVATVIAWRACEGLYEAPPGGEAGGGDAARQGGEGGDGHGDALCGGESASVAMLG